MRGLPAQLLCTGPLDFPPLIDSFVRRGASGFLWKTSLKPGLVTRAIFLGRVNTYTIPSDIIPPFSLRGRVKVGKRSSGRARPRLSGLSPLIPATTGPRGLTLPSFRTGFLIGPTRNHRKFNGRRWIRTSDFHRVRMAL